MDDDTKNEIFFELLEFFRVLGDKNRLKMLGLLTLRPHTKDELAKTLGVSVSSVSGHLYKLKNAELIRSFQQNGVYFYETEVENIEEKAREILGREKVPRIPGEIDLEVFDRKVLQEYLTEDGRIKRIPARYKKLKAVLRYIVRSFKSGVNYSENEVNEILKKFHEDTASLRRELVDAKYMKREGGGGNYWRCD